MLILAIETATEEVGCAIAGHEGVLASSHACRSRRHAESLVPMVDRVADAAGIELSQLGVVAVDVGPGLFTGLRVGLATAGAVAMALNVPMVGLQSLDLVAHAAALTDRSVASVIDARRGEVFVALYQPVPGGVQRISEPMVLPPTELSAELRARGGEWLAVGDGALTYADELETVDRLLLGDPELAHPSARVLARLAHARAVREEFVSPRDLAPVYLREPDAQVNFAERPAVGS